MGGFNSGNHGGKSYTTDMRTLDVRKLQRDGLLKPERSISLTWRRNGKQEASINMQVHTDSVKLIYRARPNGKEWQAMNYPVRLVYTACHYGRQRAWWLCPGAGCGRRVAVLYGGSVFACRHCQKLAYKSQRETSNDRTIRRVDKLRDRLGWQAGILNGDGDKPKGMHWKTYRWLKDQHDALVQVSLRDIGRKFGFLHKLLDG
jgi:hypothetical protein